ncbi:MAG: hypothetical protein JJT93_01270 [Gammaproteobacteria bacterium]|nr:hypothetical protein [Gammaproteobacteria bacterium]TVQ47943.1 MAG: hypothetical protein EA371_07040 [Gammaproteobacteria bacterium]
MAKKLPYRAVTASGNQFEFEFPLHPDTASSVHVHNLLDVLLGTLDRELRHVPGVSNGDVLQALAMLLAVRTRILPGREEMLAGLSRELLESALAAAVSEPPGNLPPEQPREVH